MNDKKRIAIVGFGHLESSSVSIELAKRALQNEGILVISSNEIDQKNAEIQIREAAKCLIKDNVYKPHSLPLLDEPYIPNHKDSKPFYYNVPHKKKRR